MPDVPALQCRTDTHRSALARLRARPGLLSVRSGWNLLLQAAAFPPSSEVLVSALTIPDMARIIEHHGLVSVPLDVDLETALPSPAAIKAGVTPRTKAVLIAHLFGATPPLDEHIALARRHGLLFVEDCAQAFRGAGYSGHPQADASLFSFGFIKTATALGGGVLIVRRSDLLAEMRIRHQEYPCQPARERGSRILRCAVLKLLSTRLGARSLFTALRLAGRDFDLPLNSRTRGFPPDRMLELIRRQPSAALLRLLRHRLATFDVEHQRARSLRGRRLIQSIREVAICPAA